MEIYTAVKLFLIWIDVLQSKSFLPLDIIHHYNFLSRPDIFLLELRIWIRIWQKWMQGTQNIGHVIRNPFSDLRIPNPNFKRRERLYGNSKERADCKSTRKLLHRVKSKWRDLYLYIIWRTSLLVWPEGFQHEQKRVLDVIMTMFRVESPLMPIPEESKSKNKKNFLPCRELSFENGREWMREPVGNRQAEVSLGTKW